MVRSKGDVGAVAERNTKYKYYLGEENGWEVDTVDFLLNMSNTHDVSAAECTIVFRFLCYITQQMSKNMDPANELS